MRLAPPAVAAALVLAPAAARADVATVSIPGRSFSPNRLTVVAGDSVVWRNADLANHDVRAADGLFDSGPLARYSIFSQRFDTVGPHAFNCSLHPFMTGEVDVVAATLSAPGSPVFAGEAATLAGRAAAGTASVALERQGADGAWVSAGATAPAADGTFSFAVRPDAATAYRATTAAGESPAVTVAVSERVALDVKVGRGGVKVATRPGRPGLVAAVEVYVRERFMWRTVAHTKLDRHGRATIVLRHMHGRARVVLSRRLRGPSLIVSRAVSLRDGRAAPDMPEAHAHHHM